MHANATEMFLAMQRTVAESPHTRQVAAPQSPQRKLTLEAPCGKTFKLLYPRFNVVGARSFDMKWAIANLLHFFAATEGAEPLHRYNPQAGRFLEHDRWIGAYGAIAMPQIEDCIRELRIDPDSRRAIVSMGGPTPSDLHRPACWSMLHFLKQDGLLHLLVYQRSLNLHGVMPYDCIVLTNVLNHVAHHADLPLGHLQWTCGSLHYPQDSQPRPGTSHRFATIVLEPRWAIPANAWRVLEEPPSDFPFSHILLTEGEART
jgi:hypothetical protein